jgi:hypothetical protein
MAFVKSSDRAVLFGGQDANGQMRDTWALVQGLAI